MALGLTNHTTVSNSSRTGAARLEGAGLESREAGQERSTGLVTKALRVHDTETDAGRQAETQGLHEKAAREQAPLVGWGPSASSRFGIWISTLLPPGSVGGTDGT